MKLEKLIFVINLFTLLFFLAPCVVSAEDWPQDAHDAAHTGYTPEEPVEPWTYVWSWNGPDANGGGGNHIYNAPKEGRIVVGGNKVFVPAGNNGMYVLDIATGNKLWTFSGTAVNASPAYDSASQCIFIPGSNGVLYKYSAAGALLKSYDAGSPINKAVVLSGNYAYITASNGTLHKVDKSNLVRVWMYDGKSAAVTPAAVSASKGLIVFATADLYVHGVYDSSGLAKWHEKPSINPAGFPYTFDQGWPVIAEKHGVVLLRMQLNHGAMADSGVFPTTNAAIRSYLTGNPQYKNLFALDLNTGKEKFIPAVGYGSIEALMTNGVVTWPNGTSYGVMGSQPVVKSFNDGSEVAYIHWRNGQTTPATDYRWGGHMGEMVLDDTTMPNMAAGDLRFVKMSIYSGYGGNSYVFIIDEEAPLSMAGDSIFHSHWGASESVKITDRTGSKGYTYSNPIASVNHPVITRTQTACADKNAVTHWTTCYLNMYNDGRYWPGPGWWVYWNIVDPSGAPQSHGSRPLYTVVSNGYVFVEGNGGDLFVLKHSGVNVTSTPTPPPTATITPGSLSVKQGDANGDSHVDGIDYTIWLAHYKPGIVQSGGKTIADFNGDTYVDGLDYTVWLNNYGR